MQEPGMCPYHTRVITHELGEATARPNLASSLNERHIHCGIILRKLVCDFHILYQNTTRRLNDPAARTSISSVYRCGIGSLEFLFGEWVYGDEILEIDDIFI